MRNPYKKFQNSSMHGSKVMVCIQKRDKRMDGRMNGLTNAPEAICPSNYFQVGGIKKKTLTYALITLGTFLYELVNILESTVYKLSSAEHKRVLNN